MKTIRELKDEGVISTRLYNTLLRAISFDNKYVVRGRYRWEINRPDAYDLTIKDIFELWTDKEILKWRGIGQKAFEELKGLL